MNIKKLQQRLRLIKILLFVGLGITFLKISITPGEEASELEKLGWKSEWMTVDPEKKFVSFEIIGGYNGANGTFNFNGFYNGELTLTVPLNWTVEIKYTTKSAYKPHSAAIVKETNPLPEEGGTVAFRGATTIKLIPGLHANESDTFTFVADKPGRYLLFCGVTGHGRGGMWDYFVVSETADHPTVHIEKPKKS
jgi:sulfocyanin